MSYIIEGVEYDLLEQFKGKKNTSAICSAIDRQLRDLVGAFSSVKTKTNFDDAVGKNLDLIGTIVDLSRAEAALLNDREEEIPYEVLSDDKYRKFLKYQAYRNANGCSYYDLINTMRIVWEEASSISYSEESAYPATILIEVKTEETTDIRYLPIFRPAGVDVLYKCTISTIITVSNRITYYMAQYYQCGPHLCGTIYETATKGLSEDACINAGAVVDGYHTDYDICGELYEVATLGSSQSNDVNADDTVNAYKTTYLSSGSAVCGIYY